MARNILWALLLTAAVIAASPARADYEAGQRAWDAGRPDVALTEWRSAAAGGDRRAMLALGRLFVKGLGAPQDFVEAHMWLNLAASRGEAAALKERDALAAKMTAEQVATAQARATAWRPAAAGTAASKAAASAEEPPPQAAAAPKPPPASPPSKEAIQEAQELLAALGYAPGPADGMWGQRSASAYKAFLKDAGLPAAEDLSADALQAMRDKAGRKPESKEATASTQPPAETSKASDSPSTPARSTGEVIAAVTELAIQAMHAYTLVKLMEDPENIAHVAPELLELLQKILSGISAADMSNKDDAQISLGALTVAERGRLSDLLKEDQGLPNEARDALSDALQAKGAAPAVALKPECAGAAEGGPCWKDVANKPGCRVWTPFPDSDVNVTWSGTCAGGIVAGQGTLTWRAGGESLTTTGTISDGKQHGEWVVRDADRFFAKGPYEDGRQHGQWVERHYGADGSFEIVSEGPYEDGKKHGRWVERHYNADRSFKIVGQGLYEDGKRQGRWVRRTSSDSHETVAEIPFVDGKRHGRMVERSSSGNVTEVSFVDGKMHGRWVSRYRDGTVSETVYEHDKEIGPWIHRAPDGKVSRHKVR